MSKFPPRVGINPAPTSDVRIRHTMKISHNRVGTGFIPVCFCFIIPVFFLFASGCSVNEKPVLRVINENTLIQCPDSRCLAREMLSAVNRARQGIHRCGSRLFSPPGPVIWSDRLSQAALRHARDMAKNDFFDHQGSDGSDVGSRANAAGFSWRIVSENISAGFESPEAVVEDWLQSPPHCANLMNPTITTIGAACARNRKSFYGTYWVLIMALPHTKGARRFRSQ